MASFTVDPSGPDVEGDDKLVWNMNVDDFICSGSTVTFSGSVGSPVDPGVGECLGVPNTSFVEDDLDSSESVSRGDVDVESDGLGVLS